MSNKESSKPKKNKDYKAIQALAESDSTELNVRPYLEEWARLHYPKSWSPNGSPDPMGAVPEMDSDWGGNAWEDLEESLPWKNTETSQGELIGLLPSKMYYPSAREAALKDFLGHLNLKQGAAVNTYSAYLTKESSVKIANNLNLLLTKMAYGVYDTYSVDERWLDGGPPWGKTKKQVAEDTKRFADEAKAQDLNLTFSSHRYGEGSMSPDEAIAKILKAKTKKDLMGYDKDLPYFYTLATQEPGFFNFLSERKPLDYDNHPLYKESSIKVANNLMSLVVKQAAPPVDPMDAEFDRQEARQEELDKQMQAAKLVNKGPQQVRGGALIKPDGTAVDPARQAQVDAANNARKAIGMTAPAVVKPVAPVVKPIAPVVKPIAPVVKPIAPVVKPKGVPSGQGGAGVDEG